MQETLIDQGLNLMLFGMGTVFVFLTILVFATTVMSRVVSRFEIIQEPVDTINPALANAPDSLQPDAKTLAAIQKAIAAHRQR